MNPLIIAFVAALSSSAGVNSTSTEYESLVYLDAAGQELSATTKLQPSTAEPSQRSFEIAALNNACVSLIKMDMPRSAAPICERAMALTGVQLEQSRLSEAYPEVMDRLAIVHANLSVARGAYSKPLENSKSEALTLRTATDTSADW